LMLIVCTLLVPAEVDTVTERVPVAALGETMKFASSVPAPVTVTGLTVTPPPLTDTVEVGVKLLPKSVAETVVPCENAVGVREAKTGDPKLVSERTAKESVT